MSAHSPNETSISDTSSFKPDNDEHNVFRVMFQHGMPVAAIKSAIISHGDVALNEDNTVCWYGVECDNEELAKETAGIVVKRIWHSAYPVSIQRTKPNT